jgi:hypothetical protein
MLREVAVASCCDEIRPWVDQVDLLLLRSLQMQLRPAAAMRANLRRPRVLLVKAMLRLQVVTVMMRIEPRLRQKISPPQASA